MTDDLKRYMPQAKLAPKTRGPGNRYIGVMNEHAEGKWVRLEDVTTMRLDVANLRSQLAEGSFYKEADIDALMSERARLREYLLETSGRLHQLATENGALPPRDMRRLANDMAKVANNE